MRSPWKLIAGLLSRGKPETSEELEDEILATPDPSADEAYVDAVTLPEIEASRHPISTQRIEEVPIGPPTVPPSGLERATLPVESKLVSSLALATDVEPVLATTIRLVTKDRLSVRAELSASTAASNAPEANAPDVSVITKINESGKLSEPSILLNNDGDLADKARVRAQSTQVKRTDTETPTQSAAIVKRSIPSARQRSSPVTKVEAAKLSGQVFIAEAMQLDNEINQLRRQLAHKLRLQNEQLKRMLARYDTY